MRKNTTAFLQKLEITAVAGYKNFISPTLKIVFGGGCRYEPTCSDYSLQAIRKYGTYKGLMLSAKRVLMCNPMSKHSRDYPLE